MNVEFFENYCKLSELKPGDTAVSKDRTKFFVCGYFFDRNTNANKPAILDMNDLSNQYTDSRDMSQPVHKPKSGDKFVCER